MKLLDGKELAGFIKERQAKDVRRLHASKISPKLAIVQVKDDPVINTYIRLKKQYGDDIGREVKDLAEHTKNADIIITATGSPAVLYSNMIKQGAVVVDAGVASEEGKTVGDLSPEVYKREDLTITPAKGGVGPLTVCALFENVIRAAQNLPRTKS